MEDLFSPEFWAIVAKRQREGQRYGQAVYNTAADQFPRWAWGPLNGTLYDPFYRDERVPEFLICLVDILTKKGSDYE